MCGAELAGLQQGAVRGEQRARWARAAQQRRPPPLRRRLERHPRQRCSRTCWCFRVQMLPQVLSGRSPSQALRCAGCSQGAMGVGRLGGLHRDVGKCSAGADEKRGGRLPARRSWEQACAGQYICTGPAQSLPLDIQRAAGRPLHTASPLAARPELAAGEGTGTWEPASRARPALEISPAFAPTLLPTAAASARHGAPQAARAPGPPG